MRTFTADLAERVLWTFVQGFVAEWLVTQSLDLGSAKVAAVAGLAAVAKCVLATRVGAPDDASTLPADY
jgi:hypothetical protein